MKNFDITFVKKSILTKEEKEEYTSDEQKRSKKETLELSKKYFVQIHYVPMESLQYIEKVLTRYGLKYEKGLNNLRWSYIVDLIRQDPKMFVEDGGWDFLSMEEKNKDSHSPYFRIVGEESHSEDSEWEEEKGEDDEEDEEEEANENGGKEEKKKEKKQNGLERMRERRIGNGEEESDDEDDEDFMPNDTSMTAEWSDFDDDVVLDKAVFSERDSDQSDRESERYARRLRRREMKQSKRNKNNKNNNKDKGNNKKTPKLVEKANTKSIISRRY